MVKKVQPEERSTVPVLPLTDADMNLCGRPCAAAQDGNVTRGQGPGMCTYLSVLAFLRSRTVPQDSTLVCTQLLKGIDSGRVQVEYLVAFPLVPKVV